MAAAEEPARSKSNLLNTNAQQTHLFQIIVFFINVIEPSLRFSISWRIWSVQGALMIEPIDLQLCPTNRRERI
jgi:hypothetical protein